MPCQSRCLDCAKTLAFSNQFGEAPAPPPQKQTAPGPSGAAIRTNALKSAQNRHPGSPSKWKIRKVWIQHFRSTFALEQSSFHKDPKQ